MLKAAVKAFVKAMREHQKWFYAAGKVAAEYVAAMIASKPRADLVAEFEQALEQAGYEAPDVNEMIRTYHAHRLLHVPPLSSDTYVPYSTVRDAWTLLVQRVDHGTIDEKWVLLPGFEKRCVALYSQGVAEQWKRSTAVSMVNGLLSDCEELSGESDKSPAPKTQRSKLGSSPRDSESHADRPKAKDVAKVGTVKDVADYIATMILEHDQPDELFRRVVKLLGKVAARALEDAA